MSDSEMQQSQPRAAEDGSTIQDLRARAEVLQQQLREMNAAAQARLVRAELKAAALHAGMIDLDGLKLVDLSRAKLNAQGELEGAAELMTELQREKPWLFVGASSSSRAAAPPAHPPRAKLATQMTAEEYRAARAELLRRR